jgi:hypothetical protein
MRIELIIYGEDKNKLDLYYDLVREILADYFSIPQNLIYIKKWDYIEGSDARDIEVFISDNINIDFEKLNEYVANRLNILKENVKSSLKKGDIEITNETLISIGFSEVLNVSFIGVRGTSEIYDISIRSEFNEVLYKLLRFYIEKSGDKSYSIVEDDYEIYLVKAGENNFVFKFHNAYKRQNLKPIKELVKKCLIYTNNSILKLKEEIEKYKVDWLKSKEVDGLKKVEIKREILKRILGKNYEFEVLYKYPMILNDDIAKDLEMPYFMKVENWKLPISKTKYNDIYLINDGNLKDNLVIYNPSGVAYIVKIDEENLRKLKTFLLEKAISGDEI